MKRNNRFGCMSSVIVFILIILFIPYCIYYQKDSKMLDHRPHDTLIHSSPSPDGKHLVEVYWNEGHGATVAPSSTVFVYSIDDGLQYKRKRVWCIYFSYRYTSVQVEWVDNEFIEIMNHDANERIVTSIYRDEVIARDPYLHITDVP